MIDAATILDLAGFWDIAHSCGHTVTAYPLPGGRIDPVILAQLASEPCADCQQWIVYQLRTVGMQLRGAGITEAETTKLIFHTWLRHTGHYAEDIEIDPTGPVWVVAKP